MSLLITATSAHIDSDVYRTIVVVLMILVTMKFFLTLFQRFLDYRLKKKMIEKGITDDVAATILYTDPNMIQREGFKWIILLLTSSIGIYIIHLMQPLGLHSISIILGSVAVGYMAYLGGLRAIDSTSKKKK